GGARRAGGPRRDGGVSVVRGRGNKERMVPLNEAAKRAMADYLALATQAGNAAASKWLFPSFGDSGHLTRQHFARELKTLAGAAGLRTAQLNPPRPRHPVPSPPPPNGADRSAGATAA